MRRLERAFDRLASRGRRSDPDDLIGRLEQRLAGEPVVVRISGRAAVEKTERRVAVGRGLLVAAASLTVALLIALPLVFLRGNEGPSVGGASTPPGSTGPAVTTTTAASPSTSAPTPTTVPVAAGEVVRLEPVEGLEPVRLSTSIGEIEFTTYAGSDGEDGPWSLTQTAHGVFGDLPDAGYSWLGWSLDGITWTEIGPAVEPSGWPDQTEGFGDDVLVVGNDLVLAMWDGAGRAVAATLSDLRFEWGAVQTAVGPHGIVVVRNATVYRWDGEGFTEASRPPDPSLYPGSSPGCPEDAAEPPDDPEWESDRLGPVVATDDGFIALAARSEDDWGAAPVCEPLVWFSADGDVWGPTTEQSPFGEGALVQDLAVAGGRMVAVGNDPAAAGDAWLGQAAAWVSDDGITWERTDLDPRTDRKGGAFLQVAGGSRGWIAVGYWDMWFSPDGHVWDGPYERPPGWEDAWGMLPGVAMLDDRIIGGGAVGVFLDE